MYAGYGLPSAWQGDSYDVGVGDQMQMPTKERFSRERYYISPPTTPTAGMSFREAAGLVIGKHDVTPPGTPMPKIGKEIGPATQMTQWSTLY
jgi:hypothetical protein